MKRSLGDFTNDGDRNFRLGLRPGGLGTKVSQWGRGAKSPEAEAVCRHCLYILTAETINM